MGKNRDKRNDATSRSLTTYIRRVVISATLLMTIFVAAVVSVHEILLFRDISRKQQETHLNEHKQFVRDLIDIELAYIASQKRMFDDRMVNALKENVCNAHHIATGIYEAYNGKLPDETVRGLIIEAVSSMKSSSSFMHVFINDLEGHGVFYAGRPEYKGRNLLDFVDVDGNYVVKTELTLLENKEEGYVSYGEDEFVVEDTLPRNKVVFVKKFEPFNWYFGSKTYLEDYYEEFKKEIAQKVSSDYFRYGGYVFINEMDGEPIVMDGKAYEGEFNMLDGSDPERQAVFEEQLEAAKSSDEGGFFTYRWNKMGETDKAPKISFVREFKECNWLVGAGFYLDETWAEIKAQKQQLKHDMVRNLLIILVVLLLAIVIEILIIYRFNSSYIADFNNFTRFFNRGKQRYQKLNIDNLYFDEFKDMGKVANEMMTERERVYKQLVLEQEKAMEADRLKTAFLANMSHEIRTPMNAILGFSSLLNESSISEEDKKMFTKLIHKNGELLLKLINDIIDISKIESDQLSISKESFLLADLLDEVNWHYRDVAASPEKNEVSFVLENHLPEHYRCHTDKLRLKQVLDNLISNAMKFTTSGTVSLKVHKRGEWIHFQVQDTGIGIPQEDLKNIFQRFRQGNEHASKHYGGTGLGLAIAQKIVHLMGGDIGVKSIPGKGSDFYFYIPS